MYVCSFCVPGHESKVPVGYAYTNLGPLDEIYFSKSHLGISRQKMCEMQSRQHDFLLDGTDVSLVVTN